MTDRVPLPGGEGRLRDRILGRTINRELAQDRAPHALAQSERLSTVSGRGSEEVKHYPSAHTASGPSRLAPERRGDVGLEAGRGCRRSANGLQDHDAFP